MRSSSESLVGINFLGIHSKNELIPDVNWLTAKKEEDKDHNSECK